MTIHSSHPFPTEEDPVRRLRGRIGGAVALVTTGAGATRTGLTVSSLMVAGGEPASVLFLVDPDSDLGMALAPGERAVVQLLGWPHRHLAEAFGGTAPAPGGPFTTGVFEDSDWGPRLADATAWASVSVTATTEVGWSVLVTAAIDDVAVSADDDALLHRRGRWQRA